MSVAVQTQPAAAAASKPTKKALYSSGYNDKYLLDGEWLYREDAIDSGIDRGFYRSTKSSGWTTTTVPNAWNATDESEESMVGGIGWYRKDFKLPTAKKDLSWLVRFESVNYRATVWLNGKEIGKHTGTFLPFEFLLKNLKPKGVNHLIIRVDSRHSTTDIPPSRTSNDGNPSGGWWNYSGILREVYIRPANGVDLSEVAVRPELDCVTCKADVRVDITAHNYTGKTQTVKVTSTLGSKRFTLKSFKLGAGNSYSFTKRITVKNPRIWSPSDPYLYSMSITATRKSSKKTVTASRFQLKTGIRSIKVSNGVLLLNGKQVRLRGAAIHEDDINMGAAINNAKRKQVLEEEIELGATIIRSHYPLHPYTYELADKLGLLAWSEVPFWQIKSDQLAKESTRNAGVQMNRENIVVNGHHPSIIIWSVANELSPTPTSGQAKYIKKVAALSHKLDPHRPVALAAAANPSIDCQKAYKPLDLLGFNSYYGWYTGTSGSIADRTKLGSYLDQIRSCYPNQALMISEFGAEANRSGPVEDKGTYEFQQELLAYHLSVYDSKPWLSGAIVWALEEFRVRPGWSGGNPRPNPPWHEKGLIDRYGTKKPSFYTVQAMFNALTQIDP